MQCPTVVVTGIGMISALGSDPVTMWDRLLQGECAIALRQPFPEFPVKPLAMIGKQPATIDGLLEATVDQALEDARLMSPLTDCGVVVGSSRGHQANWEAWAQVSPPAFPQDPLPWLSTLPHMMALTTAQRIGSTGPTHAPMAACATGLWALFWGWEWIRRGQCQRVIVGAVEAPITPLTLAGFEQMGALATTGCYPFDTQREGLVLGEGAVVLVLESAETAQLRGAPVYGKVLGLGMTADGHHVSAPNPNQRSSQTAIAQCLNRAGLTPDQVGYIHAHGTSTRLNDANEAALIAALFPPDIPVSSSKGAIGHTLGASGLLGGAFCLLALKHQVLPPCVGLTHPAFSLNCVRQRTDYSLETALAFSFGFGGQNVALALGL